MDKPKHRGSKDILEAAVALAVSRRMACPADIHLMGIVMQDLPEWPTVVQLGAGSGTLALAVFAYDRNATLFSVDNVDGGHHYEMQALQNVGIDINDGRYFEIISDSSVAGKQWGDGNVDLLIVDAAHDYESVKADIEAWQPHVNGFIFVHDYDAKDAPNQYPGVKQACDELLGEEPLWKQGWSAVFESHTMEWR